MERDEIIRQLPEVFVTEAMRDRTPSEFDLILDGIASKRCTTLRANTLKSTIDTVKTALEAADIAYETVPWYKDALVVPSANLSQIKALPQYEDGSIYLQSLSSMLPALMLAPREGADILDMCAAPGGKTCQMAALSQGKARITACELHVPRAERLRFNLERQGATSVSVMCRDARQLDSFMKFDQILLDAPCTGSGTVLLPDEKLGQRLTPTLLQKCAKSQKALLNKALDVLKPGEDLLYSTCSVFVRENEECVRQAIASGRARLIPIQLDERFGSLPQLSTKLAGCVSIYPTNRYEGFFMAKLRRV